MKEKMKLNLLKRSPRTLFSSKHKLALLFSAKAGCTFATKWFFFQVGLLEAAESYSSWIHDYRTLVFNKSCEYTSNFGEILAPDVSFLKFVRNPYSRAVSSYISAVTTKSEHESMTQFLNREVNRSQGFSFYEFILYLESINIRECDIHHRVQFNPVEEKNIIKINELIKLESSFQDLPVIEQKLGLKESNLAKFRQSRHHTKRSEGGDFSGHTIFSASKLKGGKIVPSTRYFYNQEIQDKVKSLYALDFEAYDYDLDLLPD